MGIFSRTKQSDADRKKQVAKKDEEVKVAKVAEEKKTDAPKKTEAAATVTSKSTGGRSAYVLISPRVSEKAARLADKGCYVFNVPVSANKVEVKKAIESLYKVHVTRVNTVRGIGKAVSRGRIAGRRSSWKKAIVSLKSGQKLDIYPGV